MDLVMSDDAVVFCAEVRAFLAQNLTPKLRNAHALAANMLDDSETSQDWHARLHARGWAARPTPEKPRESHATDLNGEKHERYRSFETCIRCAGRHERHR